MSALRITGRGRIAIVSIEGWSESEIRGAILAVEIDGYSATTITAKGAI